MKWQNWISTRKAVMDALEAIKNHIGISEVTIGFQPSEAPSLVVLFRPDGGRLERENNKSIMTFSLHVDYNPLRCEDEIEWLDNVMPKIPLITEALTSEMVGLKFADYRFALYADDNAQVPFVKLRFEGCYAKD